MRKLVSRVVAAIGLCKAPSKKIFVYVDGDTPTSRELEAWAAERGYSTTFSLDPAWDAVRRFR